MIMEMNLVAIIRNRKRTDLLRISLPSSMMEILKQTWSIKYEDFSSQLNQVDFEPDYKLKRNQCYRMVDFELPDWMSELTSQTVMSMDEIGGNFETYRMIQGTVAFFRNNQNEELLLFQDSSTSNFITPGRFLQLEGDTFSITEHPGFLLDSQLSAVYQSKERILLFRNFRAVNSFLPIFDFYKKVSERGIRELLSHDLLVTKDKETWVEDANQWFRTRFSRLKNSRILSRYTAEEIKALSKGYDVQIEILNGRIVLPSDSGKAKKLLRFLNEEYFKGPITDTIYETSRKTVKK